MSAKHWGLVYLATLFSFLAMDGVWLTVMGPLLYKPVLGPLLADNVALAPAALFYLLYAAGILVICLRPYVGSASRGALLQAAALGIVAYGTYDLTNHATLRTWATSLTFLDMIWGMVATTVATAVGLWVSRKVATR